MYDTSLSEDQNILATVTIPTIVDTYRKVNIFFERGVISVSIDGTRYLYFKETDGFNQGLGVASRVVSATGGAFVNVFIEETAANSKFKNLRIVNGRFISDKTSNIAFIGGNLGVGVNSPQEALDIRGNMHFNRVSNVSSVSVDSNVVTEYTGPHDRPLRKYPEVAMTANDNSSTSGYTVSASSSLTAGQPYINFDGNLASHWHSRYPYYSTSTGAYSPGTAGDGQLPSGTLATNELVSGHQGEWVSIELPKKIKLEKLKVIGSTRLATVYQFPKDVVVAVSETGLSGSWSALETATLISQNISNHSDTINITTQTSYYKYFALIVKSISTAGLHSAVEISELEFYGHEEGSGSLDTTLKTVYNVPATAGTQLEVYYDAKNYTSGTITDESPNSYVGTLNSVTLDNSAIESFDIPDGGNISATLTSIPSADFVHSVSVWVKFEGDTLTTSYPYLYFMGATSPYSGFALYYAGASNPNKLHVSCWTLDYPINFTFSNDTWHHVTYTYSGGGWSRNSALNAYVDGIEYSLGVNRSSGTEGTTPTLTTSNVPLRIGTTSTGGAFDGKIANFRLYSKALNADQVKELYDYQKDYFLGSKSQVTLYKGHLGVGVAEPSGQLELAGDERIQEYPPRAMTGYETLVEGHGVFCASWSSNPSSSPELWYGWRVFDGDTTTNFNLWHSGGGYSASGTYAATGTHSLGGYQGEWVRLDIPYEIKLTSFRLRGRDGTPSQSPKSFVIIGSNTGNEWDVVFSTGDAALVDTVSKIFTVNSTNYYKYYALVVGSIAGTYQSVGVSELRFFGTPGPTTLDKGSLTLGRSLDVPRVSRYDVDTETPRPEKLVLDLDTTVNSSPTDISEKGNHGVFYGDAKYSAPDKAFKFDGTDDVLHVNGVTGLPTGDAIYTLSCWVNVGATQTTTNPSVFYFGSSWATSQLAGIYFRDGNKVAHDIGSTNVYTTNPTLIAGKWHHIVVVKRGTGNIVANTAYQGIFVDGVEITQLSINGSSRSQTLGSSQQISVGHHFSGTIGSGGSDGFVGLVSNPKIYSVVLEPSEIKKLYNLGRTGRSMVISDTAVGIGKVPEAQLDVRGNLRVSGHAFPETVAPRYYTSIKTGRFTSASNPILTGFDNVGDGHSEPMGWEVHINFNITHSSDIEVYMDGFYTSNAPTTHRTIVEHGTRRQRQDNAGTTFYHDKFYLGSYIAHSHTSLYSVIRILNPHRQHSSIHTPSTSTVRYHAWGETVYVHPGVGTTIDYGMGNLKASGADQRLHGIRLVAQSGGLTGAYTIFAIK
jgi:hypothetical protein